MSKFTIDLLTGQSLLLTGTFGSSGTTSSSWGDISNKPVWLTGNTLQQFQNDHTHNQYYLNSSFNSFTGTTLPLNYYNKSQINSFTGNTLPNNYARLNGADFTGNISIKGTGTNKTILTSAETGDGSGHTQQFQNKDGVVADLDDIVVISSMLSTSFTDSIKLDKINGRDYATSKITTNNEISLDETSIKDSAFAQIGLIGDGSHQPSLTAFNKYDVNGLAYDYTNDVLNVFTFFRFLGKVYWNIIDQYSMANPTLVSVGTSSSGLVVSFTFDISMKDPSSQTSLFSFSPTKTVSSVSLRSGNDKIIDVTVSAAFTVSDVITTTVVVGLQAKNGFGVYQGVTNQSVTNNSTIYVADYVHPLLYNSAQALTLTDLGGNVYETLNNTQKIASYGDTQKIPASQDFILSANISTDDYRNVFFGVALANDMNYYYVNLKCGVWINKNTNNLEAFNSGSGNVALGTTVTLTPSANTLIGIERSGSTYYAVYSTDNGANWTRANYSFTYAANNVNLYILIGTTGIVDPKRKFGKLYCTKLMPI